MGCRGAAPNSRMWDMTLATEGRLETHTRGKPVGTDDQMPAGRSPDLAPGFWLK